MAGGFKNRPQPDSPCLQALMPCRVAMLTFGGKQFLDAAADEYFLFTSVLEVNESFTVVNSGLNIYVYETAKVRILEARTPAWESASGATAATSK